MKVSEFCGGRGGGDGNGRASAPVGYHHNLPCKGIQLVFQCHFSENQFLLKLPLFSKYNPRMYPIDIYRCKLKGKYELLDKKYYVHRISKAANIAWLLG